MKSGKYTLLYFLAVVLVGIAVACSGDGSGGNASRQEDTIIEPGEDTTKRESGFFERTDKHPFTNQLLGAYKLAKKKSSRVTFFVNTYRGAFFLSQNKQELFTGDYEPNKKVRYGLIDSKGNQLLATEYEKIGNPGFILDDYMEVRKDGKYGLYSYAEQKLVINPEYDAIYPSSIMAYIAIGQKGSSFFKLYPDGTTKPFKDDQPAPNYARLMKDYEFNIENDRFGLWVSTAGFDYMGKEEYFYEFGSGMIVPPSYLDRLGFFPKLLAEIMLPWSESGEDSLSVTLADSRNRSESTYSLLTSFFSYSASSRGYESEERYLQTFDRKNTLKSSKKMLEWDNYTMHNACGTANPSVRFMNDSMVEVRNYIELAANTGIPFERYTKYEYYSIAADGKVAAMSKGLFPMTSVIELKPQHFAGCFVRRVSQEEAAEVSDEFEGELYGELYGFSQHLRAADLEYMRNEIYARHGLKFKDPKWAAVFKSFKWYKGTSSNVDARLTPVEKKNLQIIKKLEKELLTDPANLLHEEIGYMEMAG